jgi:hypothetical protein
MDYDAKAARCRERAADALDERDRRVWVEMERYWLRRKEEAESTTRSLPELVKV